MGNQLVSSVKTVIRPIDYYLSEVPELKFKCSLGQTQFLKVALCSHDEGDVVVKVLSHEDPSLLLESYKNALIELAKFTASNMSIASFRIVETKPNFAYIVRQFIRFSLYDRLSTRPFLTEIEKCWIVYQLFKCISWCHENNIFHGDIKLENILVTSNLWVVISDFASYKPVNLPEDNPSFFNYFFDTSRRRCCNIAPERFVPSSLSQIENVGPSSNSPQPQQNATSANLNSMIQDSQLTCKMDMFSIGCTLAELFSDNVLFDLSGLLYYKERKLDRLEHSIKQIQNENIRDLVQNLTNLDPKQRKSCNQVLTELKGILFPNYFEKLYTLMKTLVRLPPDAKILFLLEEIDSCLPLILNENPKGILILLMVITSSLRSFKHIYCKVEAQRLICRLTEFSSEMSPFITDRLIPYLVHCLNDSDHRVRGEAIISITSLLEQVAHISPSDNNIFTDYLMEILLKCISGDKSTYVRLCMAKNIGRLSKIALKFLNQSCDHNYDQELKLLHNYFQNLVSLLITDSNNCVRRTLLLTSENCSQLCTFFGRQKTNEVILSHIITFLNDKNDFQLRLSFFENIIVIASYLGVQCSSILHPLLQQGLCDAEEIIISKTINSIASLVEQGLLNKNIILELLEEIVPLLYHPNQWITNSIVFLLTMLAKHLTLIDLNCKVFPVIEPYLIRRIHCLSNKLLLLDSLKPPLSRGVYDIVLSAKDNDVLSSLFEILQFRKNLRNFQTGKAVSMNNAVFNRLMGEPISDFIEEQLLVLSDLFMKIHRNKRNFIAIIKETDMSSFIYCKNYDLIRSREFRLCDSMSFDDNIISSANQEWQHMFGPNSNNMNMTEPSIMVFIAQEVKEVDYSYFECPPYSRDIKQMLQHKKNNYNPSSSVIVSLGPRFKPKGFLLSHLHEHKSSVNQMAKYGDSNYFLTGSDDGSIRLWDVCGDDNRYVINRSKYQFRMEFKNGSPINFKGIICCDKYIITYTNEGMVNIFEMNESCILFTCSFKVGSSKSSVPLLITSMCALSEHQFAVSLTDSVIYGYDTRYINTKYFCVPIFKVRISPNQGTITSLDGCEMILFAATNRGYIAGFDLRFSLKVNCFTYHGSETNIRDSNSGEDSSSSTTRIARLKFTNEGLYTSVYGSFDVTIWDYKLGQKNKVLHAIKRTQSELSSAVYGILPTSTSVITAGSDMRIRNWDLSEPKNSYIINDPVYKSCGYFMGRSCSNKVVSSFATSPSAGNVSSSPGGIRFFSNCSGFNAGINSNLAVFEANHEGYVQHIRETDKSAEYSEYLNSHQCSLEQESVSFAHQDCITDLLRVNNYLISSGRNGTVKVWR